MSSPFNPETIDYIEAQIGHISFEIIKLFLRQLSPESHQQENLWIHFYKLLAQFYASKVNNGGAYPEITNDVTSKATRINEEFGRKIKNILEGPILKEALNKSISQISSYETHINLEKSANQTENAQKNNDNFSPLKYRPPCETETTKFPTKSEPYNNKMIYQLKLQVCANLINKPQCLCSIAKQISSNDQTCFKCMHCNKLYHTLCMKKKPNSLFCCYCHLQRMNPLKRVERTVFIGYMKKNVKKHTLKFFIPEIEPTERIQVRCLRMKQGAQLSCLFPDVADIHINGHRCNHFEPINKQSCLKYRKDEPFNLLKGDYYLNNQNEMQISQIVTTNKQKDIRNESENHLIGIYVVEEIKIQTLIAQIVAENITGFRQSQSILQSSFGQFSTEELTCQLVKIPLMCPLYTTRIQIPVRGVYCNHFQCFDLKNYLTTISESQNPRWKCPICCTLTLELQIDSILRQILMEISTTEDLKEVLFNKNGDYTTAENRQKKNIRDLKIPQKKRQLINDPQEQKLKKRLNFIIPQHAQVIQLD